MVSRTNVMHGITGALVLFLVGFFSACSDLPTEAAGDGPRQVCIYIEGVIHCRDI